MIAGFIKTDEDADEEDEDEEEEEREESASPRKDGGIYFTPRSFPFLVKKTQPSAGIHPTPTVSP